MSSENNEPKNIQDQVKEVLSSLGDFLPQTPEATNQAENVGRLAGITLAFQCFECKLMHFMPLSPEKFIEVFAGKDAKYFFENFTAIGMFEGRQLPVEQSDIDRLLQKAEGLETANEKFKKANAQIRLDLNYAQALTNEAAIKNSHLQVENDVLRRELDKYRPGREQPGELDKYRPGREQPGETAMDYRPGKRQWKFAAVIKTIRTIGEGR